MNYRDAIEYIRSTAQFGARLGLEKIAKLCELLGNPQDTPHVIHVAGTNGKGSTTAMIASVLQAAGYKVGVYASPYIEDVRDCMHINSVPISGEELASITAQVREIALEMGKDGNHPTQFEIETAIAFQWFSQSSCEFVALETGLGGRLDATNVVHKPLVTVITSISFDHMAYLGNTIEEIAAEKCGIIKLDGITVSYPLQQESALRVIKQFASSQKNLLRLPNLNALQDQQFTLEGNHVGYKGLSLHIPLPGKHQVYNAVTALEAIYALREQHGFAISDQAIVNGIQRTIMTLRQEILCRDPLILLDGAHNRDGAQTLADSISSNLKGRRIVTIMGMLADKEYESSIAVIAALSERFIAVEPQSKRALPATEAAAVASKHCSSVSTSGDYRTAFHLALTLAGEDGAIIICGSLYLAAPMRSIVLQYKNKQLEA